MNSKLIGILYVQSEYIKEIDYIVDHAIYNEKLVILKTATSEPNLNFAFSLPYNYKQNYP